MTTIIVTHEDNEVDEFEFGARHKEITIGRRSSNDVCVPNLSVSGSHARITLQGDQAWLQDLNSTNGTYVNGQPISRLAIQSGDDIILGKVRLAFIHTSAASTSSESSTDNTESTQAETVVVTSALVSEMASGMDDFNDDSDAQSANSSLDNHQALHADKQLDDAPPSAIAKSTDADDMSFEEDAKLFSQPVIETLHKTPEKIQSVGKGPSHTADAHPLEGLEQHKTSEQRASYSSTTMHELDSSPATSKGAVIEIKNGAKSGQILPIDKPVTTLGRPGIQIAAIMRKPDGYFLMHIESDDSVDRPTLNQDTIGDEPVLLHSGDELNVAGIDVEFMLS